MASNIWLTFSLLPRVTYLVFDGRLGAVLHEDLGELPTVHRGRDVEGRVVVLIGWDRSS